MCFYWNGKTICTLGIGVWLLSKTRLFDWWDNTLMFRGRRSSQVVLDSLCTCWSISHGFIWVLHYCAMKWKVNLLSALLRGILWIYHLRTHYFRRTNFVGKYFFPQYLSTNFFPRNTFFFFFHLWIVNKANTNTVYTGEKIIYILKYSKNIKVYVRKIIQNFEIK